MAKDEQRLRGAGGVPQWGRVGMVVAALVMMAGCHGSGSSKSSQEALEAKHQVIKRGRPPMSVVVVPGGKIQLVDLADEQNQKVGKVVFETTVGPNSVVTLNPGVLTVNAKPTSAKGPFGRKHTYEIRLME